MVTYLETLLPGLTQIGELSPYITEYILTFLPFVSLLAFLIFIMGVIFRD